MDQILAVNYLTVENAAHYRKIMNYFYKRHRQMQGALYQPDILHLMQASDNSYSEIEVDMVSFQNVFKICLSHL